MLTVNLFFRLIVLAKRRGAGKLGNGALLVRLIGTLSDLAHDTAEIERRLAGVYGESAPLNRYADRLMQGKVSFPHPDDPYGISLNGFSALVQSKKPDGTAYLRYLERMSRFIAKALDTQQLPLLTYTLLEILRQDSSIRTIFYNNQHLDKIVLFGSMAHPKRICTEALLAGLWYHAMLSRAAEDARSAELLTMPERPPFSVLLLSNENDCIFRQSYAVTARLLAPEQLITVEENLKTAANLPRLQENSYPLKIRLDGKLLSTELLQQHRHIFLFGDGGAGKSFFLRSQKGLYLTLSCYKQEIRE